MCLCWQVCNEEYLNHAFGSTDLVIRAGKAAEVDLDLSPKPLDHLFKLDAKYLTVNEKGRNTKKNNSLISNGFTWCSLDGC